MEAEKRVSETDVMLQVYSVVPLPRTIWSVRSGGLENWTRNEISEAPSSTVICEGTSNWTSTFSGTGSFPPQEERKKRAASSPVKDNPFFIFELKSESKLLFFMGFPYIFARLTIFDQQN